MEGGEREVKERRWKRKSIEGEKGDNKVFANERGTKIWRKQEGRRDSLEVKKKKKKMT